MPLSTYRKDQEKFPVGGVKTSNLLPLAEPSQVLSHPRPPKKFCNLPHAVLYQMVSHLEVNVKNTFCSWSGALKHHTGQKKTLGRSLFKNRNHAMVQKELHNTSYKPPTNFHKKLQKCTIYGMDGYSCWPTCFFIILSSSVCLCISHSIADQPSSEPACLHHITESVRISRLAALGLLITNGKAMVAQFFINTFATKLETPWLRLCHMTQPLNNTARRHVGPRSNFWQAASLMVR